MRRHSNYSNNDKIQFRGRDNKGWQDADMRFEREKGQCGCPDKQKYLTINWEIEDLATMAVFDLSGGFCFGFRNQVFVNK